MASRSLPTVNVKPLAFNTLLLLYEMQGPIPSLQGTDIVVGLARCHMTHTLKQNKEAHIESETGKHILTQGYKPSTCCEDSLSPGKEEVQAQGPFLWDEWESKDCMHKTPFPSEI